jgi:hypothetical protein
VCEGTCCRLPALLESSPEEVAMSCCRCLRSARPFWEDLDFEECCEGDFEEGTLREELW